MRQRPAHPLTGGRGGTPRLEPPPGPTLTQLPSIQSIDDWIRLLHTHSHEDFATLVNKYEDDQCTPCWDASGAALPRPSQIKNYALGNLQSDLDIQDCLEGIFKLLRLDPSIALMQQPEQDHMLATGEAPTR